MLKVGGIYSYQDEENIMTIIIPLQNNKYLYLPDNKLFEFSNEDINNHIYKNVYQEKIMKYNFSSVTDFSKIMRYLRIHYWLNSIIIFSIDIKIEEKLNGYLGMLKNDNLDKLKKY